MIINAIININMYPHLQCIQAWVLMLAWIWQCTATVPPKYPFNVHNGPSKIPDRPLMSSIHPYWVLVLIQMVQRTHLRQIFDRNRQHQRIHHWTVVCQQRRIAWQAHPQNSFTRRRHIRCQRVLYTRAQLRWRVQRRLTTTRMIVVMDSFPEIRNQICVGYVEKLTHVQALWRPIYVRTQVSVRTDAQIVTSRSHKQPIWQHTWGHILVRDCRQSVGNALRLFSFLGQKPFRCPICDRRFSQSSSVTTHMR